MRKLLLLLLMALFLCFPTTYASAVTLPTTSAAGYSNLFNNDPLYPLYTPYADFNSYALPLLALDYDVYGPGGGTGPGNPYYVASTPGTIKDDIVLYTGSSGTGVLTNMSGMDNAYPTPSGTYFSFSTVVADDPGGDGEFVGDAADSWDTTLSAFTTYLGGSPLIFYFNNNENNSENGLSQIMIAIGWVEIYDVDNIALPILFEFSDGGAPVIVPGGIPVATSDGLINETVNLNLGANQAAFALNSPALDAFLAGWSPSSAYDSMRVMFSLGLPDGGILGLSNGYEQLFIQKETSSSPAIPEPASLLLLGVGLLGLGVFTKRKIKK